MKPYYKIGDKVTFERIDGSTITIAHITDIRNGNYIVDWYSTDGLSDEKSDYFSFDGVDKIRIGKNDMWKITKVISYSILPDELFTL